MRLTTALHRALQQDPDRPITVYGDRVRTVRESSDRIARLAGGLAALGLGRGERVGVLSLNSDRYHEILLAAAWSGTVVVPLNTRWTARENGFAIRDAGVRVLMVDDSFATLAAGLRDNCPELTTLVHCGDAATPDGYLAYEALLAESEPVPDAGAGGDDLFGIFYTGGTTGEPKGVMLSHGNLMANSMATLTTHQILGRGGRLLHCAPMFHLADIAAWNMGQLLDSAHVIVPAFEPGAVFRAITEHGVTDALLVPTMIQMLADHPDAADHDLGGLRHVMYGASPISEAVLDRASKVFPGAEFAQCYGMTELSPVATLLLPEDHEDPVLRRSAGRAVVDLEVRIVGPDDVELPRGEVGEVVARGDSVMQGYWNRPEETAAALRGGWMHTGDGAYMDEDGYVFIVDRVKDMIVTGGENVYSVEVEKAIALHPAVASCAVIGVPDDAYGERVHAVVVLLPGTELTAGELTDFCREHIANYKLPRTAEIVEALPVSAAGKILKRELRARHWTEGRRVN
jgi:acyl-CoA synthetase (AMP-forming)/AMP-acid ligase II